MHLNSHLMLTLFFTVCVTIMAQAFYFSKTHALTCQKITCKEELVALVGLPDLALVSEAHYVRHRSLSDVFSYFNESPELLEYFPSTFVYHYAPNEHPSRIDRVF
ncbi:putative membrane protein [Sulfurospirillum diekertiae]|uniref:Membrane protein n=2 Tax=Sulfurospirillum diekertiae TaxID=1854492 RepID=A0A290HC25_9BACT|nr:putative membrane protein [Sulfurospirillum diekertiae]